MRELPANLKQEVEQDPYYFIYQGGSDGTLGHDDFLGEYGEWMPEISNYAAKLLKERGESW